MHAVLIVEWNGDKCSKHVALPEGHSSGRKYWLNQNVWSLLVVSCQVTVISDACNTGIWVEWQE